MALEIGAAYISIIPSTKGMIRDIKRSLNRDGGRAATQAGRDMGRNMAKAINNELADIDPFDHMRTSVSKSRAEVNEFAKAISKASKEVTDANNKARVAQARYGEALSRSSTKASTLLNLQLAAKRASDDLANSQDRLAAAEQARKTQVSDLIRRERDLARATSLRAQAEKLAEMTRQSMLDRLRSRFAGRGSGLNLQVELDPGAPVRLGAELERVRNELRNRYKIELDLDIDRNAISRVGNTVRRAFNSDQMHGFRHAMAGIADGFAMMRTRIMHLVPGTWVILGTLGAIATMTFAPLIASMTQVIGLLAAIPALATAAAGAIAAIAVGSQGVFKAIGAGLKPPKNAGSGGSGNARQLEQAQKRASRAAADGAKQIAAAEKQLARAQRDAQRAQEDLSKARREAADDIADLNRRLQESQLDEEGAILGVRRAYESLRETLGDADSSALDRDEARHRYKESIANLERVRRENAELAEETERANRAGVEGHEKVIDAQERVAAAAESVTDAQAGVAEAAESAARANEDAADAMADAAAGGTAGAAAVDEYQEALADLSPAAREFVKTVLSLRDAWGTVREATQEALFSGMGPAFRRFSTTYIPVLRTGLAGIATEFNAGLGRMFEDLQRPDVVASWNGIFGNLATATAPFMDALRSISELFTDIALIGTSYFDDIAVHIRDWADGLRDAVNANPERIHGWIENGIEAFGRMKTTAGLVLELIYNIFSPGTETGNKMWDKINETLERWNDSLGKPENQERLKKLFQDALQMAKDMKEILEGTAKIVGWLADNIPEQQDSGTKSSDKGGGSTGYEKSPPRFGTVEWMLGHDANDPDVNLWSMFKGMFTPQDGLNAYRESKGLGGESGDGTGFWGRLKDGFTWSNILPNFSDPRSRGQGGDDGPLKVMGASMSGGLDRTIPQGGPESDVSTWDALTDSGAWAKQFREAGDEISRVWNETIAPVKDAWNTGWSTAGTKFGEFKTGVSTKWSELSTGVKSWYDTTIQPTLSRFGLDTDSLKNGNGIAANIMRGDWQGLAGNIKDVVDNHVGPTLERMKGFGSGVKDKFHEIVGGINTRWGELRGGTATVVNWIIDNVWNKGFVGAWGSARKFLPLPEATEMPRIPGYATGGRVDGKGTSTSDSILARLSRGEHVWDAMDVRRAGGHDTVYAIRALIERGQPFSWDAVKGLVARGRRGIDDFAAGRGDAGLPGFARGGAVDGEKPMWMQQLERGHEFAKAQDGKPYLAGNQFPAGADCSGFMSAIAGVITDDNPRAHWTTVAFPASQAASVIAAGQRWTGGLGPGMSIGMSGGPASGGPNGHTAGTLAAVGPYSAVNVESGGAHGRVAYGGPAVGADHSQFGTQYHLAIGADGAFESAGGPSPEAQKSMLRKLLEEIFSKVISPVGSAIDAGFRPPPYIDETPGAAFDAMSDGIKEETFEVVDKLGAALRAVYEKAKGLKDIVGNAVSGVTQFFRGGLLRDTGGVLPQGTSLVRNETGKPEQILNWSQIEQIQGVMRDAMRLVRDLGKQFNREADAELIAEAIGERLDKTDWEAVALRLEAFTEQSDKVLRAAGDSFADDALGVFGVRNGRKRFEEYAAIGKALSGDADAAVSAGMSGVPSPESVISGGATSRSLPSITSERMALETKLPDIAAGGGGPVKDQVRQAFAKYGWDKEPYWGAVDWIVGKESTWNPTTRNPSSGAFGLFQFLGGTKQQYLPDENPNPAVQGAAGAKYIKDRYGDPLKARAFWEQNGWYDKGGVLKPGRTLAQNDSGKDELILNNRAWHDMSTTVVAAARMAELVPAGVVGGSREGDTINLYTNDTDNAIRAFRRREAQKAQSRIGLR